MPALPSPDEVYRFWFDGADRDPDVAKARSGLWFASSPDFDRAIHSRFGALVEAAASGELDAWRQQPLSCLALILTCDQFPRNMFRGTPRAFSLDPRALETCLAGIDAGSDLTLPPACRSFFYLPMEHSEDRAVQARSVACYTKLAEETDDGFAGIAADHLAYARQHHDIVDQFGRFPHRNEILGRTSSPEERAYLDGGGATFGQ